MTPCRSLVSAFGGFLLATSLAPAQAPHNPPPWWRVQDDVTVSLAWDFDTPWQPGQTPQPSMVIAPAWYNPSVTAWTLPGNVGYVPALAGHTGVLALTGTGSPVTAALALTVDNDPHLNWIKVFWFQFEQNAGASGDIGKAIRQDLAKYKRANVTETSEPLAGGWQRVTITAQLIPQPDDETVDWSFTEQAFGTVGIDNLFINSKCIKYGQDQKGDALGDVDGFALPVSATTGADCTSAAVTEGSAPAFARSYWVGTRASLAGSSHQIFQLNQAGTPTATVPLPDAVTATPLGVLDLTVEIVQVTPTTTLPIVYALLDRRPSGPPILRAVNANTAVLAPARDVVLTAFPAVSVVPQQQFGLSFDPAGELGNGTFWVSDPQGALYEFNRSGALLQTRAIPSGTVGLGYDAALGNFYGFSNTPRPSPAGPVQVNGYELSALDFLPTGVEFCGDLRINNPGGPRGGIAAGLECYRRANDDFRLVCVVRLPGQNQQVLYELKGPYRFGWSHLGRCGTSGGAMFEGSTTFAVTLAGVPHSVAAVLFAGFSNTTYQGATLPFDLGGIGWTESTLAIAADLNTGIVTPTGPGEFRFPLTVPSGSGLSYAPVFFQWLLLDASVPGFLAMSQAGKTIAY